MAAQHTIQTTPPPQPSWDMQATPLPTLSWNTPEFLQLFEDYWEIDYWESKAHQVPPVLSTPQHQYAGPYAKFYRNNSYLEIPEPQPSHLLDDLVHPIFDRSNWITGYGSFDEW